MQTSIVPPEIPPAAVAVTVGASKLHEERRIQGGHAVAPLFHNLV
jgi:hypothetical protein